MAFIICDDHNLSVEADGMDPADAKKHMLNASHPNPTAIEKEVIDGAGLRQLLEQNDPGPKLVPGSVAVENRALLEPHAAATEETLERRPGAVSGASPS